MTRKELEETIKSFEGWRADAYRDVGGVPTIGWGRITNVKMGDYTTKEQEQDWFVKTVDGIENKVVELMTKWGYVFNDNEIYALVDFVYNLGIGNLQKLTDNGKRSKEVIGDKILLYCKCNGQTLSGLVKRRTFESNLFKTGNPSGNGDRNYTAEDLQRLVNVAINSKGLSTSKLVCDGIIRQKTINATCEVISKLML